MKCPKCQDLRFKASGTRYSKSGYYTRYRTCENCGYTATTIEISRSTYKAETKLVEDIIKAVNNYVAIQNPQNLTNTSEKT